MSLDDLRRAYRSQQLALRAAASGAVADLFERRVLYDDLDGSFLPAAEEMGPLVAAYQETAELLTMAYLLEILSRGAGQALPPPALESVAGSSEDGRSLAEAMGAIPAMMKAQIAQGRPAADVLAYGRYLVTRLAERETIRAEDNAERQTIEQTPVRVEWEGRVSATACDPCRSNNSGRHPRGAPLYRHGGCDCSREWVVAAP